MKINLQPNTQEWLDFRKNKIGASDIPIIMGVSPYSTPLILWKRKLGFEPEQALNYSMLFGQQNEQKIREMAEKELNFGLHEQVVQHDLHEWAIASLDGYNDEHNVIVEIKCSNKNDHETAKSGKIPLKYFPQLQWQYFVSEADKLYYCSFHNEELIIVNVERDNSFINKAFEKAQEFNELLKNFIEPPLSKDDFFIIQDPEFENVTNEWIEIKKEILALEEKESLLRAKMIEFTNGVSSIGNGVKISKIIKKGAVDYKKIPELEKVNLENYRKGDIETWRITYDA